MPFSPSETSPESLSSSAFLPYPRFVRRRIDVAVTDTPVVVIQGPRQSGKTTLAKSLADTGRKYRTLDDATTLAAARNDPEGFVRNMDRVAIDEVQRAPALLLAIKRSVDEDRRPGRFLLTGSADLLTLPTLADSLAGRMETVTLLPLAQAEIRRCLPGFLDGLFRGELPGRIEAQVDETLLETVLAGGYPEALRRRDPRRRRSWLLDYLDAIIKRDVRDVAPIERLDRLPSLMRLLAEHGGQLVNFAQVGGQIGLDSKTVQKYTSILESLFLVKRLPPWQRNALSRLVKTPKLHLLDAGLMAALKGSTRERLQADRTGFGPLLESFVLGELLKAATWGEERFGFSHYRDKDGFEVDMVIEHEDGGLAGIEVKAAASVTAADFRGLKRLAADTPEEFRFGAVLYDGLEVVPFGERLAAVPVAALWA